MTNDERVYEQLMAITDIANLKDEKALRLVSQLTNVSLDAKKTDGLERVIALSDEIRARELSEEHSTTLYYITGNAWANLRTLRRPTKEAAWEWEQDELEKEILNLRMAARRQQIQTVGKSVQCEILTNLANALDHVGRFVEAIELYDRALAIDPDFSMAIGNRGSALIWYARALYDPGHQSVFIRRAYSHVTSSLASDLEPGPRAYFDNQRRYLERVMPVDELKEQIDLESFPLGDSDEESLYRRWCLQNRLFLNPLNDLGLHNIAATDVLSTPPIVAKIGEGPYYQGFFNQMKQEYVSARWLYYEGVHSEDPHFSDREVVLVNTLDYPAYSLTVEKTKAAFRMAYSTLDKIAYFLNDYLGFSIRENEIAFRRIWYKSQQREKGLKRVFQKSPNWPLRGLFWLSKDLSENRQGFRDALEPEARELTSIRNHGEHKYLKLHDFLWSGPENTHAPLNHGLTDTLAHSLYRSDFEAKTMRLLKLVRAALTYLSLAVHSEERNRAQNRKPDKIIPPMPVDVIEDDWKR